MTPQRRTLREWQDHVGEWGDATFPLSTRQTVLSHFAKEVAELIESINQFDGIDDQPIHEECADVFLFLLHIAHKWQFSLLGATAAKMEKNYARTWNTTPEPGGHFKHVESTE